MSNKTLKFLPFHAPKRFFFFDPDTNYEYKATTHQELVRNITNYRSQNSLPELENIDLVINQFLCLQPENTGSCEEVDMPRGFISFVKGASFLVKNIFYGESNMVPQNVAEGRALICSTCPHNVFPNKTDFVAWADSIAEAATHGRDIPSRDKLGNCDICTCPLRAKVHAKGPFNLSPDERVKMESLGYCWQVKEG